jgi:predicted amidophosphoribosyltransferase
MAAEVRPALRVVAPDVVSGQRVLLYDDVFTHGLLLNTVAGVLADASAIEVCQVVLARQPWGR